MKNLNFDNGKNILMNSKYNVKGKKSLGLRDECYKFLVLSCQHERSKAKKVVKFRPAVIFKISNAFSTFHNIIENILETNFYNRSGRKK